MTEQRARSAALRLRSRCIFECLAIAGPALGTRWLAGHCDGVSLLQLPQGTARQCLGHERAENGLGGAGLVP